MNQVLLLPRGLEDQSIIGFFRCMIMDERFEYYKNIVRNCCLHQEIMYEDVPKSKLVNMTCLLDQYIEILTDEFLDRGLRENWEPNKYGFELEDAKDYFLKLRYPLK